MCHRGASSINLLCMHKCSFNNVHLVLCCFLVIFFFSLFCCKPIKGFASFPLRIIIHWKLSPHLQRIASQLEQEVEEALQGGENLFRDQFHGLQALRQQQQGVQSCAGHDKCGISDKIITNTSSHDPLSCPGVTIFQLI